MERLYLDLEGTSVYSNTSSILQAAYFVVDSEWKIIEVFNQYFMTDREVPASAMAVHKLSKGKLDFYSRGIRFEDKADEIYNALNHEDRYICGYNSNTYDLPLLRRHFRECGLDATVSWKTHDVFRNLHLETDTQLVRSQENIFNYICHTYAINRVDVESAYAEACQSFIGDAPVMFHNALFDSYVTMFIDMFISMNGRI